MNDSTQEIFPLRQRMLEDMRLRKLAPHTQDKFASEAVEAFEYFGATEHAALMREANAIRAGEAAFLKKYKDQGTMEAFSESYKAFQAGAFG